MPQIAINLLPSAVQDKRATARLPFHLPRGAPMLIGGFVFGALLIGGAIVLLVGRSQQQMLAHLHAQIDALNPKRQSFTALQAEVGKLDTRIAALKTLVENHPAWAERLNRLSDLVGESIWFSKLTLQPPSQLVLEGSAVERSGDGMQAVSQFLTKLQSDQTFTSVFDKITLQSFTTRTLGSTEVLDFTIVCSQSVLTPPTEKK